MWDSLPARLRYCTWNTKSPPFILLKALCRSKRGTIIPSSNLNRIATPMPRLRPLEVAQWQLALRRFERQRTAQCRFQQGLRTTPLPGRIGKPTLPNVKCHIRDREFPKSFSSGRSGADAGLTEPTAKRIAWKSVRRNDAGSVQEHEAW